MSLPNFKIAERSVGGGHPCFLIAEVAQAHDGSLGFAHSFIDSARDAGADAIKFQTHIAEAETTPLEEFRVKFSYEDATRFDYWKRMEFTAEQWAGLARHAHEADSFSSPLRSRLKPSIFWSVSACQRGRLHRAS